MVTHNFRTVIIIYSVLNAISIEGVDQNTDMLYENMAATVNRLSESNPNRVLEAINTTRKNNTNSPPLRSALFKKIVIKRNVLVTNKNITRHIVKSWAEEIGNSFIEHEERVTHRSKLIKSFADVKSENRNGSAIVDKMASVLRDLLERRAAAAENIMRKAEELAKDKTPVPSNYMFNASEKLNEDKSLEMNLNPYEMPPNCTRPQHVNLISSKHFNSDVSLETSSVQVTREVFECDPRVLEPLYWSEGLISTFRHNYAQDASLAFQYFCSAKGFLRHYPGASWKSMQSLSLSEDVADVYDCRLRPWYVSASGAPRDILILVDATGSMNNSYNNLIAKEMTSALLSALTDDDHVNVLRFNTKIRSPIRCFDDKLVPANHVNSAAMMAAMKKYQLINDTNIEDVLEYAVKLLQRQRHSNDHPPACQQAIVLLADSIYTDAAQKMKELDPEGRIRLFVIWLHDENGLRDNTRALGEWLSCVRDGLFANLITANAVTQHVLDILRVLERPLVEQRKQRLKIFSDMYAHFEDPRKGEYHWMTKERAEQVYRYRELRRNKNKLLNDSKILRDYMHYRRLEQSGHYYEGEDLKYLFQISVSVPIFDYTTLENITIQLEEEKQRNATRQYPVNRLLGVAGVDIPLEHLKLLLPYHELGPGGALFIADHRGNIVLHENLKPTFDGDILKPGYRTVDVLEIEVPGHQHKPRKYPRAWKNFRDDMIINQTGGNRIMHAKYVYENGMRVHVGPREYHWRRVLDHYTAVVVLPTYSRRRTIQTRPFTSQLANDALHVLNNTDFAIHPEWLYCRHIEQYWKPRNYEFLHFLKWRKENADFTSRKLHYIYSHFPPTPYDMPYQCDEDLMARVCHDAVALERWARAHHGSSIEDCGNCVLGSTTAFLATESGLTRWHMYHATSAHADPPEASVWPKTVDEPWYIGAATSPGTLIVHAPVMPVRRMRKSEDKPARVGVRVEWLTAARTLPPIGVTGFHFHPSHLDDLVEAVTNFPCTEGEKALCEPTCDHKHWECNLIDDAGWIVSQGQVETAEPEPEPEREGVREHLATKHPAAMAALLREGIFKVHWVHDYQAVCFTEEGKESSKGPSSFQSSLLRSVWRTTSFLVQLATNMFYFLTLFYATVPVQADTAVEKEKRRRRLYRDYEREKYERLYDPRVLVNRTRFAACDRTRALYQLQPQNSTSAKLDRELDACVWPLVAAYVPGTNLMLVSVYLPCDATSDVAGGALPIVPDPLINEPVNMTEGMYTSGRPMRATEKLACWRNRTPLPGRPPSTACFPHNYTQEEGYRQCKPWIPDPDQD